jgi:hypothetical protein
MAAYKSGRVTATRTHAGTIEVDAAELFRCFPPQHGALGPMHQRAPARATDDNSLRVSALEAEVRLLREMLDAMREDRAAWREQAGKSSRRCLRRSRHQSPAGRGGAD